MTWRKRNDIVGVTTGLGGVAWQRQAGDSRSASSGAASTIAGACDINVAGGQLVGGRAWQISRNLPVIRDAASM